MYSMAAEFLLISYFQYSDSQLDEVATLLFEASTSLGLNRVCYHDPDDRLLVEIVGFNGLDSAMDLLIRQDSMPAYRRVMTILGRDVAREILVLKDTVKAQEDILPSSAYIQIRYIEVPPNLLDDYHSWRENTIFSYARDVADVKSFEAYHSLVSREPGVKFIVAFDCDPTVIADRFTNAEYKKIIKDAGRFIVGGSSSLSTRFFKKLD